MIACLALFISLGAGAYATKQPVKLPPNSVGTQQLKPNAVQRTDIANKAVVSGKLADNSVGSGKLADKSVGSLNLADNSVGSSEVAPAAVTTSKLAVRPVVRVTRATNQAIPGLVGFVPVNWTSEVFDTQTMHDNTTNNARLTAPVAGIYDVSANVDWAANNVGVRVLLLVKNGTTGIATKASSPTSPSSTFAQEVRGTVSMQQGDYVELRVQQIHDFSDPVGPPPSMLNPLDIVSDANVAPYFSLTWVAPAP